MLIGRQIALLVKERGLISEYVDLETQLQPHGFDLTVREVHMIKGAGSVDFDNSGRKISESQHMPWSGDWLHLERGPCKVLFNEVLDIPPDVAALARPRSTLLRCGVSVHTAVWDAGYRGRSEALLEVHNPDGFDLKKDARIVQLVFFKLDGSIRQGEAYNGEYLGENL